MRNFPDSTDFLKSGELHWMFVPPLLVVLRTVRGVIGNTIITTRLSSLLPLYGHRFLQPWESPLLCLSWCLRLVLGSDFAPPYFLLLQLRSSFLFGFHLQLIHLGIRICPTRKNSRIADAHLLCFFRVILSPWNELQLVPCFSGVHCFLVRALGYSLVVHSLPYRLLLVHNHHVILSESSSSWLWSKYSIVLMIGILTISHLSSSCLTVEGNSLWKRTIEIRLLVEDIACWDLIWYRSRLSIRGTGHTIPYLIPCERSRLLLAPTLLEMRHLF